MIGNHDTLPWILVPDCVKLLQAKMGELFDLFLLRTDTIAYIGSLLSIGAVPNGVEVYVVRLVVFLEGLFLRICVLSLSRT